MTDPTGGGLMNTVVGLPARLGKRSANFIQAIMVSRGGVGADLVMRLTAARNTIDGQAIIDKMAAEEVGRRALADPDFMRRMEQRFLLTEIGKQENIEAVAIGAAEIIEQNETEHSGIIGEEFQAPPSAEWVDSFTGYAEKASSDEVRARWSKVLAGEFEKPGSFSPRTMRFLADLDQQTAKDFVSVVPLMVGDAIFHENDWNWNERYDLRQRLIDADLMSPSESARRVVISPEGHGLLVGSEYGLIFYGPTAQKFEFEMFAMTRIAAQLANVLGSRDEKTELRKLVKRMSKDRITRIVMGRAVELKPANFQISLDEVLWPEPRITNITLPS